MTSLQKVVIENRDIPILEDDEVLVQVEYVGICGSDLHYFESGRIGDFVVKPRLYWDMRLPERLWKQEKM